MACFLVSGGEGIAVAAVRHAVKKNEQKKGIVDERGNQITDPAVDGICWTRKLGWLMNLLWGGVLLLAIEHIWHGEVVLWPPFLTAMQTPEEIPVMLHEMATVGVSMAILLTVVWVAMVVIADYAVKRSARRTNAQATANEGGVAA